MDRLGSLNLSHSQLEIISQVVKEGVFLSGETLASIGLDSQGARLARDAVFEIKNSTACCDLLRIKVTASRSIVGSDGVEFRIVENPSLARGECEVIVLLSLFVAWRILCASVVESFSEFEILTRTGFDADERNEVFRKFWEFIPCGR